MAIVINTNVPAMTAQRNLVRNSQNVNKSFERLASGYRINKAADDAAGLSISEGLRTQTRGLAMAINNAQDGVNLLNVAEGGMSVITENLQRIRELTVQAANDTNATSERMAIAREVGQRLQDITRIADTLKFNNIELLTGQSTNAVFQIGANSDVNENTLNIGEVLLSCNATALGISVSMASVTGGSFSNGSSCRAFLDTIDSAIDTLFSRRSLMGAYQNRLESTIESLTIQKENLTSSESRIRDLDIAAETANMTKNQILQQSAMSVLMQANQTPSLALSLLG